MTEKERLINKIIEKFKRLEEISMKKTSTEKTDEVVYTYWSRLDGLLFCCVSEKRTHKSTVRISYGCTGSVNYRPPRLEKHNNNSNFGLVEKTPSEFRTALS